MKTYAAGLLAATLFASAAHAQGFEITQEKLAARAKAWCTEQGASEGCEAGLAQKPALIAGMIMRETCEKTPLNRREKGRHTYPQADCFRSFFKPNAESPFGAQASQFSMDAAIKAGEAELGKFKGIMVAPK